MDCSFRSHRDAAALGRPCRRPFACINQALNSGQFACKHGLPCSDPCNYLITGYNYCRVLSGPGFCEPRCVWERAHLWSVG